MVLFLGSIAFWAGCASKNAAQKLSDKEWKDQDHRLKLIKKTREKSPDSDRTYYYWGQYFLDNNEPSKAVSKFTRSIKIYKKNYRATPDASSGLAEHYLLRGRAQKALGNYEEAIVDFAQGAKFYSGPTAVYYNEIQDIQEKSVEKGEEQQVLAGFSDALNEVVDDDFSTLLLSLRASLNSEIGDYESAVHDLSRAIVINPESASLYQSRARIKLEMDDKEGYEEDLKMARKLKQNRREESRKRQQIQQQQQANTGSASSGTSQTYTVSNVFESDTRSEAMEGAMSKINCQTGSVRILDKSVITHLQGSGL